MVTVWWSAPSLIHYSFLNPWETITSEKNAQQIPEVHWKLHSLQPALWTERAQFFTTPNWCHITNTSKVEWIWLWSFASSVISSPTNYCFKLLDNFMQGKPFHNQQEAENAFQEFIEFRSTNFYATGINKLISYCLKCIDCIGSYFNE